MSVDLIKEARELGLALPKSVTDAEDTYNVLLERMYTDPALDSVEKLNASNAKTTPAILNEIAAAVASRNALREYASDLERALTARIDREWRAIASGVADGYLSKNADVFQAVNDSADKVPAGLAANLNDIGQFTPEEAADAARLMGAVAEFGKVRTTVERLSGHTIAETLSQSPNIRALAEWTDFSGDFRKAWQTARLLNGATVFSAPGAVALAGLGIRFVARTKSERDERLRTMAGDVVNWDAAPGGGDLVPVGQKQAPTSADFAARLSAAYSTDPFAETVVLD